MHIAIVRRHYSLKRGGAERHCVNLSRQLRAWGHRVTVLGEAIDDELRREVEFLPVPVTHTTSWTRNRSFAENAARIGRSHRFDIVHGLSRSPGVDTFRITDPLQAHWLQVYYVGGWQRILQSWNPRHRTLLAIERSIYQSRSVRRIITQSRLDSHLVMRYYGVPEERIRRVQNGVDTRVFHPGVQSERAAVREELGLAADEPLLIFASMDFRRKGLGPLLQTLSYLRRPEARLLVLGDGPQQRYARLADRWGVRRQVIFAGRRQAMQRYYGAGDLFVLPTLYEPFPNVNLEAMACGLPVLTTETAGGADIVHEGRNGYLVPHPEAIRELAARIDHHLSLSEADKRAMSGRCWETARELTVEKNAREMLAVFEEVLLEKSRV